MIQLVLNNSTCRIEGLSSAQQAEVAALLSYRKSYYGCIPITKSLHCRIMQYKGSVGFLDAKGKLRPIFTRAGKLAKTKAEVVKGGGSTKGHWFRLYPLISRKGEFPTGLLYLVEPLCKKLGATITDTREKPEGRQGLFDLKLPYEAYPEQIAAAEACAASGRGIVSAPTALGKSAIIALIIQKLQVPTLVVVPTLELKRQLTETFLAMFGKPNPKGLGWSVGPIFVENVDALDPNQIHDVECVIIDEFHHSAAKTYRKLNRKAWSKVYYKFGMTATPFRSNGEERLLLESVLSKVVYEITYQEAVAKGRIAPLEAYYVDIPITEIKGNPMSWPAMYSELVVNNAPRNKIIAELIDKTMGQSILCLVKEIEHGENICDFALERFSFAHGQDQNVKELIKLFNNPGFLRKLVATIGIAGEGVDTKPAEYVILAGLGRSRNQFMQQCGRVLRLYPGKESGKVILFRDKSHKWTLQHFNEQVRILKSEYGIIPVKLTI